MIAVQAVLFLLIAALMPHLINAVYQCRWMKRHATQSVILKSKLNKAISW